MFKSFFDKISSFFSGHETGGAADATNHDISLSDDEIQEFMDSTWSSDDLNRIAKS